MPEKVQPLVPQDIIQSAESLSVVAAFATGENKSLFKAATLMPEYRGLVIAYGQYCTDLLKDKRVAAYLPDTSLAYGSSSTLSMKLSLQGEAAQVRFSVMDLRERVGEEAIKEEISYFEQRVRNDYTPEGANPEDITWDLRPSYRKPQSYDTQTEGDILQCIVAERAFQPVDFISHPELLQSFVRKMNTDMTRAQSRILQAGKEPISDANQRALDLINALKKANEILAPVIQP